MNKIIRKCDESSIPSISGTAIPVGTYFYGEISSNLHDHLFLRVYDAVVSITDPSQSWGDGVIVQSYRPVEVTVVVERYIKIKGDL